MIFTFTMTHLFISTVRDYAFPPVVTAFWRAVCVVYHLRTSLFCHSDWRGKLAAVNDGRRAIPGSRYFIAGIFATARTQTPPLRPLLNAALIGLLLLAVGNGMVTVAEHQNVPSGIAAVVVATVPSLPCASAACLALKRANWNGWVLPLGLPESSCSIAVEI